MVTKRRTVSVRLDSDAARRLEMASRLAGQSQGTFLEKAGDEAARRLLLAWAIEQYRVGAASFSRLAEQTGPAIEEIMRAVGEEGRDGALEAFLASSKTIAESTGNPEFLRRARAAIALVASSSPRHEKG